MMKKFAVMIVGIVAGLLLTTYLLRWLRDLAFRIFGIGIPDTAYNIVAFSIGLCVIYLVSRDFFGSIEALSLEENMKIKESDVGTLNTKSPCNVVVNRNKEFANRKRFYQIIIDTEVVGYIENGGGKACPVSEGEHKIAICIDFCETKPITFSIGHNETKEFICGSNLSGIKLLLLPWFITFGRHNYLWLHKGDGKPSFHEP